MKLNRKWLMVIALVLSLTMATAGTLAYLTDRDTEVNVFTMGNVDIDLNEEFEPGAELIPGLDVKKEPTITNVGPNDAWVWATIAIPSALDNDDASANVVHFNMSKDSVAEGKWTWWAKDSRTEWLKQYDVEYDGVNYNVFTVLYQTALKKGDTTEPVIYKVYMDPHVDVAPDGQLHHVENGEVTELDWNINDEGNPKIYVSAYAMQTDSFDDVYAAYAAYTQQWGTDANENAIAWGVADDVIDKPATSVGTMEDLEDAFIYNSEISVTDSIDTDSVEVPAEADIVLELGNNTISTDNALANYGTAVIENGTLENSSTSYGTFTYEDGDTTFNNVDIVTAGGGVNVRGAESTATFNSGSVTTNSMSTSPRHVFYVVGNLTINDGVFTFSPDNLTRKGSYICAQGPDANVVVNGGTFNKPSTRTAPIQALDGGTVTIYGGKFAFDPSEFVADGYAATKGDDGYWTVAEVSE